MQDQNAAASQEAQPYGKLVGQQIIYLLEERTTLIGRDEECDIVFDSKSISKKHASLHFLDPDGLQCELIDHMSRNGCFVNEDRVWNTKRRLEHGDLLRFGYDIVSFKFEYTNPNAIARQRADLQDTPFGVSESPDPRSRSPSGSPERPRLDPAELPAAGATSAEIEENRKRGEMYRGGAMRMGVQRITQGSQPRMRVGAGNKNVAGRDMQSEERVTLTAYQPSPSSLQAREQSLSPLQKSSPSFNSSSSSSSIRSSRPSV